MIAFKDSFPDVTVYIVWQRDNWITSKKLVRYSDWAKKAGFESSVGKIKKEWLV